MVTILLNPLTRSHLLGIKRDSFKNDGSVTTKLNTIFMLYIEIKIAAYKM